MAEKKTGKTGGRPPGRPTGSGPWLTEEGLLKIIAWARDGLTDAQIAHNMGIGASTLYKYQNEHPEITAALRKGKEVIDIQVENALLKRALGYKYTETSEEKNASGDIVKRVTEKEERADTTAQIFWLKNRKPKEWREKRELEVSGELNNPYKELTQEQLIKLADEQPEYF